ncbi:hypothetical protein P154DRAFT_518993 [Amniculicola lignicola CBS 123094]|uniref:Uncharacterized protein n=1 Tax=Amniculicola lignicola CBS 123094 TaxID=1392246 RepID=A0A6A5WTM7_9PLEO|nr:hypothetical protein P154DRAFT_518993 [Amniculicola lignicola CBS 123094]
MNPAPQSPLSGISLLDAHKTHKPRQVPLHSRDISYPAVLFMCCLRHRSFARSHFVISIQRLVPSRKTAHASLLLCWSAGAPVLNSSLTLSWPLHLAAHTTGQYKQGGNLCTWSGIWHCSRYTLLNTPWSTHICRQCTEVVGHRVTKLVFTTNPQECTRTRMIPSNHSHRIRVYANGLLLHAQSLASPTISSTIPGTGATELSW